MKHKSVHLFLPPKSVGEVGASEKLPIEVEVSFDEACILAHGKYRGWRVFVESAISVIEPKFCESVRVEEVDHLSME